MRNALFCALLAAALPLVADEVKNCIGVPYEYCQVGCGELGGWAVAGFNSMGAAATHWASLTSIDQVSAFIVQPPHGAAGALMLHRITVAEEAVAKTAAANGPRWMIAGYTSILDAAFDQKMKGGYIYSTNQPEIPFARVWYEECWIEQRAAKQSEMR